MKWPEDGCHTTRSEHQLRTDLGIRRELSHLSFVSALLRERGKNKRGLA